MNAWNSRRPIGAAVAGVLLLGATAGCGSSSNSGNSAAGSSGDVSLVVYSSQGYDSAVTKAFTKATGIPVSLDDDSTGPLLAKVAAETNNPQWGLLWVDGDTAFAELDKQGQLLDYNPGVTLTAAGQELVPTDHAYSPVSTTAVPALVYNAAKVSSVPTTWQDLLEAQYKGKIGMNDPSQSGPTFPLIAGLMNELGGESGGVAAGESYLNQLKANGLQIHPTNGDTLHAAGDRPDRLRPDPVLRRGRRGGHRERRARTTTPRSSTWAPPPCCRASSASTRAPRRRCSRRLRSSSSTCSPPRAST